MMIYFLKIKCYYHATSLFFVAGESYFSSKHNNLSGEAIEVAGLDPPPKKRKVNTSWEIFWFIVPCTLSQPLKRMVFFSHGHLTWSKCSTFSFGDRAVLIRAPFKGQRWNSNGIQNRWVSYSFRLKPFLKPNSKYGIFTDIWQNVYGKCRELYQTLSVSEGMELCLLVQGWAPERIVLNGATWGAAINGRRQRCKLGWFHPTYRSYDPSYNW